MGRPAKKPDKPQPRKRADGEIYARPVPNPFSGNWHEGFTAGYDHLVIPDLSDLEWRDGYWTGIAQLDFDSEELDRTGTSNT